MQHPKEKSRTRRATRAIISSNIRTVIRIVVGFIITPFVLGFIGRENFGVWVIIGNILGYMGMFDMGITGSVSTLIARKQYDQTGTAINSIVSNSIFMHTVIGILVLCIGITISFYIPGFFKISSDLLGITWKAFLLATIGLSLSFPLKSLQALLRGTQNISTVVWIELFYFLLRTALIVALLYSGLNLLSLPLGTIIVNTCAVFTYYYFAKRLYPQLRMQLSQVNRGELKKIFSVSMWWFLGGIGALFIYSTDNIVIGHYLGPAMVTVYALTYRISELGRNQIYQINDALRPGVGDLVGRKEYEKLKSIFLLSMKTILVISIIFSVFFAIYNKHILKFWVGEEYFGGGTLTLIFAISLVQFTIFHNSSIILTNFLSLKDLSVIRWLEGIFNLILSLILIKYFGIVGVALGTLLAGFLTSLWYVPLRANILLKVSFDEFFKSIFTPVIVLLVILLPLGYVLFSFNKENLLSLIANIVVFGLLSLAIAYFIVFNKEERANLLKRVIRA